MKELFYNNILIKETKYKGYYASKNGELYSVWKVGRGATSSNPFDYNNIRTLKTSQTTRSPYLYAKIRHNGKYIHVSVHRTILETFLPIDNMENLTVNHKDCNKLNNSLDNLEWLTQKENVLHAVNNNRIWNQQQVKCTHLVTGEIKIFPSINLALKYVGSKSSICNLNKKKNIIRKNWRFEINN